MAFKLVYSAQLLQLGPGGVPIGNSYSFSGTQFIAPANPQPADLTTAANAMGADILNQMANGTSADPSFAVQQSDSQVQD